MTKTTLVLGASAKRERYSNQAVRKLLTHGHPVVAVGRRTGTIDGLPIVTAIPADLPVHTITMYLNADVQRVWEKILLDLSPARIIFNPGAENPRFAEVARARGIEVLEACTLVMLGTGQY